MLQRCLNAVIRAKPLAAHRGSLSPSAFVEQYQLAQRPGYFPSLVVPPSRAREAKSNTTDGNEDDERVVWPALETWSRRDADGKETLGGMRREDTESLVVPVEISMPGMGYNATKDERRQQPQERTGWERVSLPFGLFLDAFITAKIPWSTDASKQAPVGYLAQHDLLASSPSLSLDAPGLPHSKAGPRGDREQWRSNVWIGPAATFTPIHRDPYSNLFVQVVGRKRIHVFPPTAENCLYLFEHGRQVNTSRVQKEEVLLKGGEEECRASFPDLEIALGADATAAVEVGPGDVVYIPPGWFHCVKSLETSASVNWWYR